MTDDGDEYSPLMAAGGGRNGDDGGSNCGKDTNWAINCNRVLIILLLVAMTGMAITFQNRLIEINAHMSTDDAKIAGLEDVVDAQAKVIQRFNESVSNADVLKELHLVEESLQRTQTELETELDSLTIKVTAQLDDTMVKLDDTVKKAETEITKEVSTMKTNFEQYVVDTQAQFSMENSFMVYQIAGTLVLLSCLISSWHMSSHLRRFRQPAIQRKVLAILWMSPIYAITSWFSLVFTSAEGYLAIVKDAYEAYIIYQFLSFCIAVMGKGDRDVVVDILSKRADHLSPPFRIFGICCKAKPYESDRALADAILLQCQFFALQFVFFRPLTTIATVFLNKYEYFGPFGATSANDYRAPQIYVSMIQNLSIFIAFTGLLKFYHAVDKDLAWCRPFAKFLCIKGVVFMTFWQGLAITILAETTDVGGSNAEEWAQSAQNFLICLEMLIFSIAHFYCFPTEEWEPNYKADYAKAKFGDSLALGDFMADLKLILRSSSHGKKKKKKMKKVPSDATIPEVDEENADDDDDDHDRSGNAANRDGNESENETEEDDDNDDDDDPDDGDSTSEGVPGMGGTSVMSDANDTVNSASDIEEALTSAISNNIKDIDNSEAKGAAERLLNRLSFRHSDEQQQEQHPNANKEDRDGNDDDDDDDTRKHSGGSSMDGTSASAQPPDETTGLLSASKMTYSERQLRPSIFTTIADIAASDDDMSSSKSSSFK